MIKVVAIVAGVVAPVVIAVTVPLLLILGSAVPPLMPDASTVTCEGRTGSVRGQLLLKVVAR